MFTTVTLPSLLLAQKRKVVPHWRDTACYIYLLINIKNFKPSVKFKCHDSTNV